MSDPAPTMVADAFVETEQTSLDQIAFRICQRDELLRTCAHTNWFENGIDLHAAKRIIGHGGFEAWCKEKLDYSPRTAQKKMQAATVFAPWLKNESGSDLPEPSLVYLVSAPSTPQEIRDVYVPRIIAGEKVGPEVRAAIKQHRKNVRKAKRRATLSPEEQAAQDRREAAKIKRDAGEQQRLKAEREKQAAARAAAVDLIVARLGEDLAKLLAFAAEAGPIGIFSHTVQQEVERRSQAPKPAPEAGIQVPRPTVCGKYGDVSGMLKDFAAVRAERQSDRGRSGCPQSDAN